MAQPILYHSDMSVCAAKVRILLADKGIPWKGELLHLREGDAQRPDYVRLNPLQVVPTLVNGDDVVIESNVILEYIEDRWPQLPARPTDPGDIARMRLWMKQLDDNVHVATGIVSTCIAFRHQYLKLKPADLNKWLDNMTDPVRRARSKASIEQGMDADQFTTAVLRFRKLLDDFETQLSSNSWLAGQNYSLADIAYSSYMLRLEHLGFSDLIKERPRVAEWKQRLFARPGFKAGVLEWLDPAVVGIFDKERPKAEMRIREIIRKAS